MATMLIHFSHLPTLGQGTFHAFMAGILVTLVPNGILDYGCSINCCHASQGVLCDYIISHIPYILFRLDLIKKGTLSVAQVDWAKLQACNQGLCMPEVPSAVYCIALQSPVARGATT